MACEFDHPDCLNCPYEDCTATSQDIIRQWKLTNGLRRMDDPDSVPTKTSKFLTKQQKYELSEKGKIARQRYNASEKGKERMKQYNQSQQGKARQKRYAQSEKGRATKRRYYLKKKLEREAMMEVKDAWKECKNRGTDGWSDFDKKQVDMSITRCSECAEEHRQLAEWLKDYKRLLEQEPKTGGA